MTDIQVLGAISALLLLANVLQFVFWGRQVRALVDRLMSRNYAEYAHYQVNQNRSENRKKSPEQDPSDDEVLAELNQRLLGV